ncbi:micronuclear linker histone polyprotein isoform X2 [Drosophila suzukii]|uniref:Micronuclear linker histone polyprotein isoform X2 n=1 Tax=Drosophila suzukii TaxID=28584 RepID=A0ABM4TVV3_DROSZ
MIKPLECVCCSTASSSSTVGKMVPNNENQCCLCTCNRCCKSSYFCNNDYSLLKRICHKIIKNYNRQQCRERYTVFDGGNSIKLRQFFEEQKNNNDGYDRKQDVTLLELSKYQDDGKELGYHIRLQKRGQGIAEGVGDIKQSRKSKGAQSSRRDWNNSDYEDAKKKKSGRERNHSHNSVLPNFHKEQIFNRTGRVESKMSINMGEKKDGSRKSVKSKGQEGKETKHKAKFQDQDEKNNVIKLNKNSNYDNGEVDKEADKAKEKLIGKATLIDRSKKSDSQFNEKNHFDDDKGTKLSLTHESLKKKNTFKDQGNIVNNQVDDKKYIDTEKNDKKNNMPTDRSIKKKTFRDQSNKKNYIENTKNVANEKFYTSEIKVTDGDFKDYNIEKFMEKNDKNNLNNVDKANGKRKFEAKESKRGVYHTSFNKEIILGSGKKSPLRGNEVYPPSNSNKTKKPKGKKGIFNRGTVGKRRRGCISISHLNCITVKEEFRMGRYVCPCDVLRAKLEERDLSRCIPCCCYANQTLINRSFTPCSTYQCCLPWGS